MNYSKKQKKFLQDLNTILDEADSLLGNDKHGEDLMAILSILPDRFKTYFNTYPEPKSEE